MIKSGDDETGEVRWSWRRDQEDADHDLADEVSEEVDSRREVMRSEKKDCNFLRRSELVGEQEWRQMKIEYYVEFGGQQVIQVGRLVV